MKKRIVEKSSGQRLDMSLVRKPEICCKCEKLHFALTRVLEYDDCFFCGICNKGKDGFMHSELSVRKRSFFKRHVPVNCDYYAEYCLSQWNDEE